MNTFGILLEFKYYSSKYKCQLILAYENILYLKIIHIIVDYLKIIILIIFKISILVLNVCKLCSAQIVAL